MSDRPVRILILGSGFAGLHASQQLERALPGAISAEITIVNRDTSERALTRDPAEVA
jgi:NADH dehydrogenase FAD-containing subunit